MSTLHFCIRCEPCRKARTAELTTPEQLELGWRAVAARGDKTVLLLLVLQALPRDEQRELLDFLFAHEAHGPLPGIAEIEELPQAAQVPWTKGGEA